MRFLRTKGVFRAARKGPMPAPFGFGGNFGRTSGALRERFVTLFCFGVFRASRHLITLRDVDSKCGISPLYRIIVEFKSPSPKHCCEILVNLRI